MPSTIFFLFMALIRRTNSSEDKNNDWHAVMKETYLRFLDNTVLSFLQSKSSNESSSNTTAISIGAASGGILLLATGGAFVYTQRKKRRESEGGNTPPLDLMDSMAIEALLSEDEDLLLDLSSQLTIKDQESVSKGSINNSKV